MFQAQMLDPRIYCSPSLAAVLVLLVLPPVVGWRQHFLFSTSNEFLTGVRRVLQYHTEHISMLAQLCAGPAM